MKRYNFSKFFASLGRILMVLTLLAGVNACDDVIYNYGEDCEPDIDNPAPPTNDEVVKIFVRSNPGGGGMSNVLDVADESNSAGTEEGIYVSIDVKKNGAYTLTATETNPEYEFVRWHDDTNDGDLTEGMKVISNIKAEASNKYTAIFRKIEEPEPEPEPGSLRIYVRTNPGSGGTSRVHEVADEDNSNETTEGIYASIDIKENGTYTLTAEESNPDYEFVKWHDDTNEIDLTEGKKVISNIKAEASNRYTAIFREIAEPEPEPEPGRVRISVRTNPGGGGTSRVHEVADEDNSNEDTEGFYASIEVEENGTYTLTAEESNPEYEFVKWHDDTNEIDLTEGKKVIPNITAEESNRYTAIFRKIEQPAEPERFKIFVRSNPSGGGMSKVQDIADAQNNAETDGGSYVTIEVEENGAYTLTATESNPDYEFVRWHDDINGIDFTDGQKVISDITATESNKYTAIFQKIEEPEPEPEPGRVRISVRSNPGSGGTSKVHDDADSTNASQTEEGLYVNIEVEENGTYTLTATESNPEYEFVRWHDDTNDSDLTEGKMVIPNIKAEESTRYTAVFRKIEQPAEPSRVKIFVRSNPAGGGMSKVQDNADSTNAAETDGGIYVTIMVEENGTFTLTATESNPEYEFVRWHDDTNDSDLTEGLKVIPNIVAEESTRYTAVFRKIEQPEEPEPIVISVRTNPGSGGTSRVYEVGNTSNAAQTDEGIYVNIEVAENGKYTLTADESNPDYEFVNWHDDTNGIDLTEGRKVISDIVAKASNQYTAIFRKIEAPAEPEPIVISVRTNPGSGGTSRVHEVGNTSNAAQTQEGIYVSIQVAENGTYTLTATESNPDYEFVRWHDDTNDGNLTEGKMVITDIVAKASNQYTAIFKKKGAPEPSDPTDPDAPVEEGYYVKFVFERNMQDANAVHRVNSIDLYVFNTSGSLVKRYQETRPIISEDYLMELTDLPAGTYELVAWCGLYNNNGHFTVSTVSRNSDATCTMATPGGVQNKNLNALYHGRRGNAGNFDDVRNTGAVTYYAKTEEKQIHTVYLTKDTNNIMLTLQHRKYLDFEKERFVVTMEDDNNKMSYTNQISSDASTVRYEPYRTVMGNTSSSTNPNTGNFMLVELSTARLMATHNPIIYVYDTKENKTIFSIPLVKWALQFRSANHKDIWGDQEYLDREDNYNLMLWMDSSEGDGWFGAQIEINDWHVVDDSMDIK